MVAVEQHPKPRQRKGTIKDNMISDNAYLVLRSKIIVIVQQDFSNANTRTEATLTERALSWRGLKNQPSICIVFYACPPTSLHPLLRTFYCCSCPGRISDTHSYYLCQNYFPTLFHKADFGFIVLFACMKQHFRG